MAASVQSPGQEWRELVRGRRSPAISRLQRWRLAERRRAFSAFFLAVSACNDRLLLPRHLSCPNQAHQADVGDVEEGKVEGHVAEGKLVYSSEKSSEPQRPIRGSLGKLKGVWGDSIATRPPVGPEIGLGDQYFDAPSTALAHLYKYPHYCDNWPIKVPAGVFE